MLELPPELHLRIAECLSQADLLNFRLSCKALSSPGHSVLFSPQKASQLYIHPTTIQRFIDICHDDALANKVATVIVLGDFMLVTGLLALVLKFLDLRRKYDLLCRLPWPRIEGNDLTDASHLEKAPFQTAYMRVIAATKRLSNLQKIAYATSAKLPGLNSTSDTDIMTQARQCPSVHAWDDDLPMEWSDTELIMGLALNVPNIAHVDAGCSQFHVLGDTNSFGLLFPEGKSTKVRYRKETFKDDIIRKQVFEQLNLQLRSITYGAFDNRIMLAGTEVLGDALLDHCSSIRNVELITRDSVIDDDEMAICMRACRGLKSLCSFKVRLLEVDPTLDCRVDDDDPSTREAALECASTLKSFLLQHAKTLETCVIDSIVSTSEHQLNILAGGLKGFSATGKNAQVCFRTYKCKLPAVRTVDRDDLKALRIVMGTE
ncbi:hypothetical protein D0861_01554 [Hortaea werneckii]|uniref:F-box domain-containing protein n=1 Tax=Hortaea werneckii TaxID=91943 RepID=A0A3M7FZB0_HORWE|nr:hypothetical protein D0861_01554 [Hortaea werneckii]